MALNLKLVSPVKRKKIKMRQWRKFRNLIRIVLSSNSFYRNKYKKEGIKTYKDIKNWQDFKRLPFTTKKELCLDQKKKTIFGTNVTRPLEKEYERVFFSTGTTRKNSFFWFETHGDARRRVEMIKSQFGTLGIKRGNKILIVGPPYDSYPRFASMYEGLNEMRAMVVVVNSLSPSEITKNLKIHPFDTFICPVGYSFHLAELFIDSEKEPRGFGLKKIIALNEPGGSVFPISKRIEEIWGAKVYDFPAMGETGGSYAADCFFHSGPHLTEDWYIFEIIDPKKLTPADEGELVITNLWREGFPLIRYRTGDYTEINQIQCRCGSPHERLKRGIWGRIDFAVNLNNHSFFPSDFDELVFPLFPAAREYRVEIDRSKNEDRLTVKLEVEPGSERRVTAEIRRKMKEKFGLEPDFIFLPVGTYSRFMRKFSRVVDKRKSNQGRNFIKETRDTISRFKNRVFLS